MDGYSFPNGTKRHQHGPFCTPVCFRNLAASGEILKVSRLMVKVHLKTLEIHFHEDDIPGFGFFIVADTVNFGVHFFGCYTVTSRSWIFPYEMRKLCADAHHHPFRSTHHSEIGCSLSPRFESLSNHNARPTRTCDGNGGVMIAQI